MRVLIEFDGSEVDIDKTEKSYYIKSDLIKTIINALKSLGFSNNDIETYFSTTIDKDEL